MAAAPRNASDIDDELDACTLEERRELFTTRRPVPDREQVRIGSPG
jgi:hypothetical protein